MDPQDQQQGIEERVDLEAVLGITDQPRDEADPLNGGSPAKGEDATQDGIVEKADESEAAKAKRINDKLTHAFETMLENPDLPCLMVELLDPGLAVVRVGGGALAKLTPMQHLAISTALIGVTVVATNPGLTEKLKASFKPKQKKEANRMPAKADPDLQAALADQASAAEPAEDVPSGRLDLNGKPLPVRTDADILRAAGVIQ